MRFSTTALLALAAAGTGLGAPGSSPDNVLLEKRVCNVLGCAPLLLRLPCLQAAITASNPQAAVTCIQPGALKDLCNCLDCIPLPGLTPLVAPLCNGIATQTITLPVGALPTLLRE